MVKRKFTVFLLPLEEGGYQAFFPHYPNCVSDGLTVEEALRHARESMEGILQADAGGGDPVPMCVHFSHLVVGEVDVHVPDSLVEVSEEAAPVSM